MGAKVASRPSNQRGMRYRSCRNGIIHEMDALQMRSVYGVLRR
jgi:hypothetical protein